MKARPALVLILLVVTTIGFALPLVAASIDCQDDGDVDCCGLDCALCVCCSHTPRIDLSELDRRAVPRPAGELGPEERLALREPLPRDVLHVPRPAPVR